MVEKSSRCGGYESNVGYKSEESRKEKTRPRNLRRKTKRKLDQLKEKSYADQLNKGNWRYTLNMPLSDSWEKPKRRWYFLARSEAMRELKLANPNKWKNIERKRLKKQME